MFILGTTQDDISCKSTRRRSVLSQEITAQQVFKHFPRNESVPSNREQLNITTHFQYCANNNNDNNVNKECKNKSKTTEMKAAVIIVTMTNLR